MPRGANGPRAPGMIGVRVAELPARVREAKLMRMASSTRAHASPGALLLANWRRLSPRPFGRRLFSLIVGRMAPYTGSIGAVYDEVRPGHARVILRDRRAVRNHLASIHAVALVNLAEMTSGVALTTALPPGVRGIPTGLSIAFLKKARGTLVCTSDAEAPARVDAPTTHDVVAKIHDAAGDLVAECTVHWRLSPPDGSPPGRA